MELLSRSALSRARTQHGLLTGAQLQMSGVSDRARGSALRSGQLVIVSQGVYRLGSHPETFDQRCLAGCLAAPHAVLSGPTAGRLYSLRKVSTSDVHMLARTTVNVPGVIGHRTNLLADSDVVQRGQMSVLRPARLICDLAGFLSDEDLASVIEQVLERRMVSLTTIRDAAARFLASGRNGTSRLARVLNSRPAWIRPPESDLELQVLRALADRGVHLVPQFELEIDGGRVIRLDMADPELRFGVEVDHATWHSSRLDVERDKQRDRQLLRMGWTVPRVTDSDIEHRMLETMNQLVSIVDRLRHESA